MKGTKRIKTESGWVQYQTHPLIIDSCLKKPQIVSKIIKTHGHSFVIESLEVEDFNL